MSPSYIPTAGRQYSAVGLKYPLPVFGSAAHSPDTSNFQLQQQMIVNHHRQQQQQQHKM